MVDDFSRYWLRDVAEGEMLGDGVAHVSTRQVRGQNQFSRERGRANGLERMTNGK